MAAGGAADLLEYFHDVRLVRAFEIQGPAVAGGDSRELGDCVFRIPAAGAGESVGEFGLFAGAIEDHAGGDHALRVHRVRDEVFSEPEDSLEPYCGVWVHHRGGGVCGFAEELKGSFLPQMDADERGWEGGQDQWRVCGSLWTCLRATSDFD